VTGTLSVYRREGRYLIQTMNRTKDFLWIERDAHDVGEEVTAESLGSAVRAGLGVGDVVRHPKKWPTGAAADGLLPPLAGVKNWKVFAACAAGASVDERGGRLSVTPNKRDKDGRTYEPMMDAVITFDEPFSEIPDAAIGTAVIRALDASGDDRP
jgi:hypothetical protein